jgi:hypothetical protein
VVEAERCLSPSRKPTGNGKYSFINGDSFESFQKDRQQSTCRSSLLSSFILRIISIRKAGWLVECTDSMGFGG